jgi:glutathione S-transferase
VLTLYDAARCPYCARARIVLAEKGIAYDPIEIDLDDRPAFIYELNPPAGRVPVLEEDSFVLPESPVIMDYLDERFPDPPLLPSDPGERALARLRIERFDDALGDAYYDVYLGRPAGSLDRLDAALTALDGQLAAHPYLSGASYGLADISYVPWIMRAQTRLGQDLSGYESIGAWLDRLLERPAIAAEQEIVGALPRVART